jgi:hypothetical protein
MENRTRLKLDSNLEDFRHWTWLPEAVPKDLF